MPTLPIRDYLYAGAIVILLIAFMLFVHHERSVGEAKVVAADQKAVAAQVERNTAVQAIASVATQLASQTYEHTIAAPVAHVAPIKCLRLSALRSEPVPVTVSSTDSGNATPVSRSADIASAPAIPGPDLATALVTIGRDSDAQIKALQAIIASLRKEMENPNVK